MRWLAQHHLHADASAAGEPQANLGARTFNPIGLDQVLTVPTTTATGRFLVYEACNRERETICRLRVDVVSKGSESDPDKEAVIGFVVVIASSAPIAVGTSLE